MTLFVEADGCTDSLSDRGARSAGATGANGSGRREQISVCRH